MNFSEQINILKAEIDQHQKNSQHEAFQAKVKTAKLRKLEKQLEKLNAIINSNE